MNKNYVLNSYQVETLTDSIRYTSAREKAMSILAYLTRLEIKSGTIEKTYKDLHRMHQKSSKRVRVSFQRFKAIMKQLIEIGLLNTDTATKNSIHKYTLVKIQAEIQAEIQANENQSLSVEDTGVEGTDVCDSNKVNNTNIYNTRQKEVITDVAAVKIATTLFADLKIKNKDVKKSVIDRVKKVACTINPAGAVAYISKIILSTNLYYKELYKQIKFQVQKSQNRNSHKIKSKKITLFREKNYDYNALERELLGWDD